MRVNQQNTSRTGDSFGSVPQGRSGLAAATSPLGRSKQPVQDTVNFSAFNQTVASLAEAATEQSPSRAAKVQALKEAVKQGQYQPDSTKIAASIANAFV